MDSSDLAPPGTSTDLVAAHPLTEDETIRARELARAFDPFAGNAVVEFAVAPQKRLADLADPILVKVRFKDAGPAAEPLAELMERVRELDVNSLAVRTEGLLARLPLIGRGFRRFGQFLKRFDKIAARIDRLVDELKRARQTLLADVSYLDRLYAENLAALQETVVYVRAGEIKLDELRIQQAGLQDAAAESANLTAAQRARDLGDLITRLERRVHDLKLTALISLQMAPQIRLVQAGDQALIEKIQSSILTTIPLWKNQIVLAIGLLNQQKALELQRAVTNTTNQILARNAQLLQQGVTGIARESERGLVELSTLQEVNDRLIATIQETLAVQAEGRQRRVEAEGQLHAMQLQLQSALAGTG